MGVREIYNKKVWEEFFSGCVEKTFLQSWNWGEFQKSLGNPIWRFGIYGAGELVSVALTAKHQAKRGSFLLVPHGPVMKSEIHQLRVDVVTALKNELTQLARKERVDFIRVSSIWKRTDENEKMFQNLGFRLRPLHTHPESSWKLDITPGKPMLFSQMRKTTRYLIKQAEHDKNIEVFQSKNIKDVTLFNQLHLEVVKRQRFVPFSLEYFQKEFLAFLGDDQIAIFFAKYKGKIVAASYVIFWSDIGFYHHAALLPEYRRLPVAYLLQWEVIKEAKRRNCESYDFWGYIDPKKYPQHPYAGPTLFKMGFGGEAHEYVKTQDFAITKKYWLNYLVETARRIKRGL